MNSVSSETNVCALQRKQFDGSFDFFEKCPITADIRLFKNFLNSLASRSNKKYYFTVKNNTNAKKNTNATKNTNANTSKIATNVNIEKKEFTWDNVRAYGTNEQKKAFNQFRRMYVTHLIQQFCYNPKDEIINSTIDTSRTQNTCDYKIIGTPPDSVESDMDFDFKAMENADIGVILTKISVEHHKYFDLELDELFDTNLYGSVFVFDKDEHNNPSPQFIKDQNVWSWIRAVELLNNKKYVSTPLLEQFRSNLISSHQTLFNNTLSKSNEMSNNEVSSNKIVFNTSPISRKTFFTTEKLSPTTNSQYGTCPTSRSKTENYRLNLSNYFAKDYKNNFEGKTECFSSAKYYENETYRSLGAVLHIVNKLVDINENYFIHSVYDQFGFVVENILEEKLKKPTLDYLIPKTAKYIYRICDAIEKLKMPVNVRTNLIPFLYEIKRISEQLNNVRRSNDKTQQANLVDSLKKQLYFSSVENNIDDEQTKKIFFLISVYTRLIAPIGKYQCYLNQSQDCKEEIKEYNDLETKLKEQNTTTLQGGRMNGLKKQKQKVDKNSKRKKTGLSKILMVVY